MRYWIVSICLANIILGATGATASEISDCNLLYSKGQYEVAFSICKKAAKHGDSKAQFYLGEMYSLGKGVTRDPKEAIRWYRKAALQGDITSQQYMGSVYFYALGETQDNKEAAKWFRKSAEQGDVYSQYTLGSIYYSGRGIGQDYREAAKWFLRAAEQGDTKAQFNIGLMYFGGQGIIQNYKEAAKWFRKAAEQGHANAQFNLAAMYESGQGLLRSSAAAADWYYKAGVSYLKQGDKDGALRSVERIKGLTKNHIAVPNIFLADRLLQSIYGSKPKAAKPHVKHRKKIKHKHQITFGTGWPVVGGFVVTNHHVVAGHKKIVLLRQDGVKILGSVAMDDATNDLVLIRVKDASQLPPALPLATGAAHAGSRVFTIGYPHPDFMGSEPKVTDGLISAVTGLGNDPRTYQISVPIQAGNSGGPLLNMNGEVVGITASKLSAAKIFKWTGDLPQNVNYAIKTGYLTILLSSVPSSHKIPVLPARAGNVEQLAARIEKSVLIVIAQ